MAKFDLTDLYKKQAELDAAIAANHNITYETTRPRRILALLVEFGEFANSTRCFKYWSNKPSESRDRVLDEYADGLHFFLSLGICIGSKKNEYEIVKPKNDLTDQFLKIYKEISEFEQNPNEDNYERAFSSFFNLLPLLNYKYKDLEEAYYKKLGTNYKRQETNY